MRIVFFTQEDPFYVKIFFDEFLAHYKSLDEIKAIVISKPMGKKSIFDLAKQMYNFYGPADFVRVGLKFVYYKILSRRKLFKPKSGTIPRTYSVKQTALLHGIEVIERSDLNSKSFLSFIKKYDADLFISVASPIIFRQELISIPKLDCINIHNAPLPKYRGMLPNFWQMYHDEKKVGITVHKIETGIDTGDIIAQFFIPVDPYETLDDLIIKTKKENALIIMNVIEDFRNNRIKYRKMFGKGSYFTFPTHSDLREFRKRGKKIM